jgi:hypothetical protein
VSGLPSEAVCFSTAQAIVSCGLQDDHDGDTLKILLLVLGGVIILITVLCFRLVHTADRAERGSSTHEAAQQDQVNLDDVDWAATVQRFDTAGDGRLDAQDLTLSAADECGNRTLLRARSPHRSSA